MKLKIKEAIEAIINPTSIWKIHVKSMHGDADAYTEQSKLVETTRDVKNYIKFLTTVWIMAGDEYNNNEVRKAVALAATELDLDGHGEDLWMDMVKFDQTNDENYACVDEIWVTYFDYHGIEFKVDIVLEDGEHNKINKYKYTGNRF